MLCITVNLYFKCKQHSAHIGTSLSYKVSNCFISHCWKSTIDVRNKKCHIIMVSCLECQSFPGLGRHLELLQYWGTTTHHLYTVINIRLKVSVVWWSYLQYIKLGYVDIQYMWTSVFNLQYMTGWHPCWNVILVSI